MYVHISRGSHIAENDRKKKTFLKSHLNSIFIEFPPPGRCTLPGNCMLYIKISGNFAQIWNYYPSAQHTSRCRAVADVACVCVLKLTTTKVFCGWFFFSIRISLLPNRDQFDIFAVVTIAMDCVFFSKVRTLLGTLHVCFSDERETLVFFCWCFSMKQLADVGVSGHAYGGAYTDEIFFSLFWRRKLQFVIPYVIRYWRQIFSFSKQFFRSRI